MNPLYKVICSIKDKILNFHMISWVLCICYRDYSITERLKQSRMFAMERASARVCSPIYPAGLNGGAVV